MTLQKLRFEMGDLYTVSVGNFFGCDAPSSTAPQLRGDVSIAFTCDPANKVGHTVKEGGGEAGRRDIGLLVYESCMMCCLRCLVGRKGGGSMGVCFLWGAH